MYVLLKIMNIRRIIILIKKTSLSILLAASLTFGATTTVWAAPKANLQSDQTFDNKIVKRINGENIYNHIAELSQNPRVAGTPGEVAAVEYIKSQFESYGYDTEVQPFEIYSYTAPSLIELSVDGMTFKPAPIDFSYGVDGEVMADLVYAGLGATTDFKGIDVQGKIALIERGTYPFAEKILNAADAGAAGVIIYNNSAGVLNGTLGVPHDYYVPALAITQEQGKALKNRLDKGETIEATLKLEGAKTDEAISHNVVATRRSELINLQIN